METTEINNVIVTVNVNPSVEDHTGTTKQYGNDVCAIAQFHNRQQLPGGVLVGSWSVAGPTWTSPRKINTLQCGWSHNVTHIVMAVCFGPGMLIVPNGVSKKVKLNLIWIGKALAKE